MKRAAEAIIAVRTGDPAAAARALDRYTFSIRNGRLWLDRLYSVSRVDGVGAQARIQGFPLEGADEAMRVIKSGEAGKVIFEIA